MFDCSGWDWLNCQALLRCKCRDNHAMREVRLARGFEVEDHLSGLGDRDRYLTCAT